MNRRPSRWWLIFICGFAWTLPIPVVRAAAPPLFVQQEISYLIADVAASGCEFYRNGKWYDAVQAAAHLREKYGNPFISAHLSSAEEFIDRVATRSTLSGVDYAIRCQNSAVVPSSNWFLSRLAAYRIAAKASPPPLVPAD